MRMSTGSCCWILLIFWTAVLLPTLQVKGTGRRQWHRKQVHDTNTKRN